MAGRGLNKVTLIGNLGRDPELSYTPSGLAVVRLSLATTERRKNQEGEWTDATEWHRIKMFGKQAEAAGQYLSKGQTIYLEGRLTYGSYEKEGVKHYTTDIICNQMIMLSRRDEAGAPPKSKVEPDTNRDMEPGEPPEEDIEDDLPF